MDRNGKKGSGKSTTLVALRKESVDRNPHSAYCTCSYAWVALRKESVDRNQIGELFVRQFVVALRKESVDRNRADAEPQPASSRRSPQGERG